MMRSLCLAVVSVLATVPAAWGVSISDPTYRLSVTAGVDGFEPAYRDQDGYGTCWTFGTMASVESNLIKQGLLPVGTAGLSERDLAWHSGFTGGVDPLNGGGSYMFSSAYFARGTGPLTNAQAPYWSNPSGTGGTILAGTDPYPNPATRPAASYYVRDVEWYHNATDIKKALLAYGAVATCWAYNTGTWLNNATYAATDPGAGQPNHSVAIVGWDDNWVTTAPSPGAWVIRNSWGSSVQHFGMSYYDYFAGGNDPVTRDIGAQNMGAVSFHNVVPNAYKEIYYHNDLGWTNQQPYPFAFNHFTANQANTALSSVSFYTTADNVTYEVKVFEQFSDGLLSQLVAETSGTIAYQGFHTVDLPSQVLLANGQDFYIELYVSNGWQACDGNVNVTVVTGGTADPPVSTTASLGQSYYSLDGRAWSDLQTLDMTANFAIDGLTVNFSGADVPEPTTLALALLAGLSYVASRRRARRS